MLICRRQRMVSVPIFEAKNKLPQFIHQVEEGETLGITRHGKVVAYLVGEDGLNQQSQPDNAIRYAG